MTSNLLLRRKSQATAAQILAASSRQVLFRGTASARMRLPEPRESLSQRGMVKPCSTRNALETRAGDRTRTGDSQLGKLVLYQLSYARIYQSIVAGW